MCKWAYPQEILIHYFSWSYARFELRNFAKMKDTTETVCQRNSSVTAQQNFGNTVVVKDIPCRCAQEILIQFFFSDLRPFELRKLAKMKDTTQNSLSALLLSNRSTEFHETL